MKKIFLIAFLSLSTFVAFSQSITVENTTSDDLYVKVFFQAEAGLCAFDGVIRYNLVPGEIRTDPVGIGSHVFLVQVNCVDCDSYGHAVNYCVFDCAPLVDETYYAFNWDADCDYLIVN